MSNPDPFGLTRPKDFRQRETRAFYDDWTDSEYEFTLWKPTTTEIDRATKNAELLIARYITGVPDEYVDPVPFPPIGNGAVIITTDEEAFEKAEDTSRMALLTPTVIGNCAILEAMQPKDADGYDALGWIAWKAIVSPVIWGELWAWATEVMRTQRPKNAVGAATSPVFVSP